MAWSRRVPTRRNGSAAPLPAAAAPPVPRVDPRYFHSPVDGTDAWPGNGSGRIVAGGGTRWPAECAGRVSGRLRSSTLQPPPSPRPSPVYGASGLDAPGVPALQLDIPELLFPTRFGPQGHQRITGTGCQTDGSGCEQTRVLGAAWSFRSGPVPATLTGYWPSGPCGRSGGGGGGGRSCTALVSCSAQLLCILLVVVRQLTCGHCTT